MTTNTMPTYVLQLADPRADLDATGGKGMSLAKMINAGLPVPIGFHVTTAAYRRYVDENGLQDQIMAALKSADANTPATLEAAAESIQRSFEQGRMPAEIAEAVSTAYAGMNQRFAGAGVPVAVRSSATAEDLPDASFAGQQETYLNICGVEALLEAVRKCWASLWTARAISYRLKNQIDQNAVALAVVVQELVFADAAGILFTANPLNGHRDELVINAAWGLGEAVVSGAVTPDTLTMRKDKAVVLHRETADKQVMTVRTAAGTQEIPVPENKRRKAVLSASQAAELARLGVKIEAFYGMPMDVEWALAGGQFAILQARPITALPLEWKVPYPGVIYARGSLAEHIPSPVTPLFATLGVEMANAATSQLWDRVIGKEAKDLLVGDGFYQPVHGYVYGGMRMTGKDLFTVTRMSISQIGPMFHSSIERWQEARQRLAAVVQTWERKPIEELPAAELLEGVQAVFSAACCYFTDIQTTLPAASMSEVIFGRFYNAMVRRKGDPEYSLFLLGADTVALRAEKSLYDLSQWVQTEPALRAYIASTPTGALAADLHSSAGTRADAPEGAALPEDLRQAWQARFQAHLQAFGRTAYEFDFANPTPLETPGPMLDTLKGFLLGQARSPYERQRQALEKREQATQAVLSRLIWPAKTWFEQLLRWAQKTSPMREDAIFDMGMGHPLVRRMFTELGRRFVAGGALEQAEDIYWLEKAELAELVQALEAGQPLPRMNERIPERKAEWQGYLKITPPVMLPERSGWMKFIHGGEAERKNGKVVLKGAGTSGGKVTAPACVLFGPEDFGKMKPGDVLIAVTTTPAWTPLFALASAVVTDIGGPLSHSSIVAREYGIPAVMAARTATRAIQSGQMITVDGTAGTVTLE